MLSFLYDPTLISVNDYWKNQSFDYTDFCQQSDVSAFNILSRLVTAFFPKEQVPFNFMAAVTIYSDSGAQENSLSLFPLLLLLFAMKRWDGTRCHDLPFLNVEF